MAVGEYVLLVLIVLASACSGLPVGPSEPPMVLADFASLAGTSWTGSAALTTASGPQTWTAALVFDVQAPVRGVGFTNDLYTIFWPPKANGVRSVQILVGSNQELYAGSWSASMAGNTLTLQTDLTGLDVRAATWTLRKGN